MTAVVIIAVLLVACVLVDMGRKVYLAKHTGPTPKTLESQSRQLFYDPRPPTLEELNEAVDLTQYIDLPEDKDD